MKPRSLPVDPRLSKHKTLVIEDFDSVVDEAMNDFGPGYEVLIDWYRAYPEKKLSVAEFAATKSRGDLRNHKLFPGVKIVIGGDIDEDSFDQPLDGQLIKNLVQKGIMIEGVEIKYIGVSDDGTRYIDYNSILDSLGEMRCPVKSLSFCYGEYTEILSPEPDEIEPTVNDNALGRFAENFKYNIEELEITGVGAALTSGFELEEFVRSFSNLKVLKLTELKYIDVSPEFFLGFPNLEELGLEAKDPHFLPGHGFVIDLLSNSGVVNNLRKFHITAESSNALLDGDLVDDNAVNEGRLKHFFRACSKLEDVKIESCCRVDFDGQNRAGMLDQAIIDLASYNPFLKRLDISRQSFVNEGQLVASIDALAQYCPHLESITIRDLPSKVQIPNPSIPADEGDLIFRSLKNVVTNCRFFRELKLESGNSVQKLNGLFSPNKDISSASCEPFSEHQRSV